MDPLKGGQSHPTPGDIQTAAAHTLPSHAAHPVDSPNIGSPGRPGSPGNSGEHPGDSASEDAPRHPEAPEPLDPPEHAEPQHPSPDASPRHGLRPRFLSRGRAWIRRAATQLPFRSVALPASKDGRHIPLDFADDAARPPRLTDERRGLGLPFLSNAIRTSRYTVLDFVPKQLLFQFTRLGNFYFLCVGVPQTIPGISTTGNVTTILPLMFFVLLTVVKEGYDDYKRHRLDKIENASPVTVLRYRHVHESPTPTPKLPAWPIFGSRLSRWTAKLRSSSSASTPPPKHTSDNETYNGLAWTQVHWRDVHVGDVIKLARDEDVPADILLLHADGEGGMAYVETMALDGETNLKSKTVPAPFAHGRCATIEGIVRGCDGSFIVVEDPNPDLYRFDGRLTTGADIDDEPSEGKPDAKSRTKTIPLTLSEIIYRGCTVRNTATAIGLVVNTGEECKSRMNANRHPRAKKPALEHATNGIVLVLAAYVILLTAGCSVAYYLWRHGTESRAWYLSGATVTAAQIIIGFAIQFNNVIPLALYVSLEIVKLCQMLLLNADIAMYDAASDTPARCNTNTILEDLGQIGYVFSDKTGTLTENVMKFRKMSVAGTSWLHEADLRKQQQPGSLDRPSSSSPSSPPSPSHPSPSNVTLPGQPGRMSTSSRIHPTAEDAASPTLPSTASPRLPTSPSSPTFQMTLQPPDERRSSSVWRSSARPDHVQPELTTDDLLEYIRLRPHAAFTRKAVTYILALALCHTCLPEVEDGRVVRFQAASPDELALVSAAEELGFLVIQKSSHSTTLRFTYADSEHPTQEVYEVVDVIEFSSLRKRMSVIVRRPDGRLWLICKGADSVVLPRLKMAPLAMQKARDVRKSADLEREMIRKSEQLEPRTSFGGPASVVIRKSFGGPRDVDAAGRPVITTIPGGPRLSIAERSQSFDMQRIPRRSADALRSSHAVPGFSAARAPSFDTPLRPSGPSTGAKAASSSQHSSALAHRPLRMQLSMPQRAPLPEKFAFLESASVAFDDDATVFEQCFKHCDDFAAEGLRTLLFAHKFIPEAEYRAWKKDYHAAATSLTQRQERIEAAAEAVEQNLSLLGASAIEDKLQRGVPDTVEKLRRANIKIWMLTGDKRETAINIAHSARICRPASEMYMLDASRGDLAGQLLHIAESLGLHTIDGGDEDLVSRSRKPPSFFARMGRFVRSRLSSRLLSSNANSNRRNHTVVVIDGHTLGVIEDQKRRKKQHPLQHSQHSQHSQHLQNESDHTSQPKQLLSFSLTKSTSTVAASSSVLAEEPDLRDLFYSIIPQVDSVICCRASPSQKALLVRSIRNKGHAGGGRRGLRSSHTTSGSNTNPGLTLAIGDGANDLAMLAEAHVGVGVSGREGLQAARVADYSIAQFRFLGRLLLVHGRWNYVRTARFILSTFWKEMFFYTPAAAYQWYCGYTGTSIYESWSLTVLNTLFTSLCTIVPAIMEQDLGAAVLTAVPELYAFGQRGQGLNPTKYMAWMLAAVAEGVVVWFACWAGFGLFLHNNHDTGLFALGDLVFSVCIMWTNVKLFLLNTHFKSVPVLFAFVLTIAGWWIWNAFLSASYTPSPSPYAVRGGFFHGFGREVSWWLTVILIVLALAAVELFYRTIKRNMTIRHLWRGKKGSRRELLPSESDKGILGRLSSSLLTMLHVHRQKAVLPPSDTNARTADEEDIMDFGDISEDDEDGMAELAADELDLGLWQDMEKDPNIQARLRLINGEGENEGDYSQAERALSWGFPWSRRRDGNSDKIKAEVEEVDKET